MAYNDSVYLNTSAMGGGGGMFEAASTDQQFSPYNNNYFQQPGWHIGSQYVTPSYTANMRPSYGGPTGNSNPWQNPPGYGTSVWAGLGAAPVPGAGFGTESPWHENAMGMDQYHSHNLPSTISDASVSFGQQWIMPGLAYLAANRLMNRPGALMGGSAGAAWRSWTGRSAPRLNIGGTAGSWIGRGVGGAVGRVVGGAMGALTGFGSAAGGAALGSGVMGAAGAAIGTFAAPLAVAYVASQALNKAFFDPYVNIRRGAEATMSNFYGRYVGGEGGNVNGGLGVSATMAYNTSMGVQNAGWNDFGLSQKDYTAMMDYGMQSGLYNDIPINSRSIVDKTKKIAGDVKKIMQVFGEKDMQEAIGILTKFSQMGAAAGSYETSAALASLKMGSAITGKSAGEIFNTVGAQGQYLYQSMGMSGIAGVLNATNLYSGMAQANKMGLVSTRMLSLMGGIDGATQAAMQGRVGLQGTDYNKMVLFNQFVGGKSYGSISENLNAFSRNLGGNPVDAMGKMILHGADMQNAQAMGAAGSEMNQVVGLARSVFAGQKLDANKLAVAAKSFGLDDTQIKALLIDMKRRQSGGDWGLQKAVNMDNVTQQMDSEGWGWYSQYMAPLRRVGYKAMQAFEKPAAGLAGGIAWASDATNSKWTDFKYGSIDQSGAGMLNLDADLLTGKKGPTKVDVFDTAGQSDEISSALSMINDAAMGKGNLEAMQIAQRVIAGQGSSADIEKVNTLMGGRVNNDTLSMVQQKHKRGQFKTRKDRIKDITLKGMIHEDGLRKKLMGSGFTLRRGGNNEEVRAAENAYGGILNLVMNGADGKRIAEYLDAQSPAMRKALLNKLATNMEVREKANFLAEGLIGIDGTINAAMLSEHAQDGGTLAEAVREASMTAAGKQWIALNEVGSDNRVADEARKVELAMSTGILAMNGDPTNSVRTMAQLKGDVDSAKSMSMASTVGQDIDLTGVTSLYGDGADAGPRMIQDAARMMLNAAQLQANLAGKSVEESLKEIRDQNLKLGKKLGTI